MCLKVIPVLLCEIPAEQLVSLMWLTITRINRKLRLILAQIVYNTDSSKSWWGFFLAGLVIDLGYFFSKSSSLFTQNWPGFFPQAKFAYTSNSPVHFSTGLSYFQTSYGYHPHCLPNATTLCSVLEDSKCLQELQAV